MSTSSPRLAGLDAFRVAAFYAVLLSHSAFLITRTWPGAKYFSWCGVWGVEMFFTLSGLLIGKQILSLDRHSLLRFWRRRLAKIAPGYYFALLAFLLAGLAFGTHRIPISSLFLGQFFLKKLPPPAFNDAWTVAVEAVAYFAAPLCFLVFRTTGVSRARALFQSAIALLFLGLVLRFIAHKLAPHLDWRQQFRQLTWLRVDALAAGFILAVINESYTISTKNRRIAAGWGGGFLVLLLVWFSQNPTAQAPFRLFYLTLLSFGLALLLPMVMAYSPSPNAVGRLTWLSERVYSLYLGQCLTITLLLPLTPFREFSPPAVYLTTWLAVHFVGFSLYRFIERPARAAFSAVSERNTTR